MPSATLPLPAALWAVVLLAACSAPPPASAPPSGEVAVIEANRRAGAYLRSGNLERSEEHTSELQSLTNLVCRLLLEKKKSTCPHCLVTCYLLRGATYRIC